MELKDEIKKLREKGLGYMNRKAVSTHQCKCCEREFTSYANDKRKYCSHECYIKHRFGGSYEH